MATVTFDKLSYSQTLRSGGFTSEQAETSAHALDSALRDSVATKADLGNLKVDIDQRFTAVEHKIDGSVAALEHKIYASVAALEHKIDGSVAALEHKIDGSVAALEHKIDHSVALLRQEIATQKVDLVKWLVPVLLGQVALTVALMKLI